MCSMAPLIAMLLTQTIYTWTDARGTVYYTDDPSSIPADVKAATTTGDELSRSSPEKSEKAAAAAAAAAQPAPDPRAEEEYWRGQFRPVRERIRLLEDDLAADQRKIDDPARLP